MYAFIKSQLKKRVKKDSALWRILKQCDIPAKIALLYAYYKLQPYPRASQDDFTRHLYFLLRGRLDLIFDAYCNKSLDRAVIDPAIIKELNETMPGCGEGGLLDMMDLRARTQINFLASALKRTNAKRILETGTHKAMFCYLAHLCNESVTIDTFGNRPESQKAADILNQRYNNFITFHFGDSRQTLSAFSPDYRIDFAWVDGGHSFEVCYSDLVNCARLKIPDIAIDDYRLDASVKNAVDTFIKEYGYSISAASNILDCRGVVRLTKN